jgi:succinate-acetate transporter protein
MRTAFNSNGKFSFFRGGVQMQEQTFNIVNQAVADPSTVGLASFGIGLFTLSFLNAGLIGPNSISIIIPLAVLVGLIHFFACLNGFKKNELFTGLVFGIYGMFWVVYGLINFGVAVKWYVMDANALLVFLVAYTIFNTYVLVASFVTNWAVILTLALLEVVFLLLDFGLAGHPGLIVYAGYIGMVDGLMALYISAAGLLASLWGRSVLPVGPIVKASS